MRLLCSYNLHFEKCLQALFGECEHTHPLPPTGGVAHTGEMTTMTNQHREIIAQLREEIESLSRAHGAALARLAREKDSIVSSMEDEKSLLAEQISKLEILLDEKSDELRRQHQHASQMAAEQKVHIQWF